MYKFKLFKFIIPVLLLLSGYAQASPSYSNVYIFGDSLSDTGNLASVDPSGPFPFPYYMNRVTNGPVAVDTLASHLGYTAEASLHLLPSAAVGNNYAVARANAFGEEVLDLGTQVHLFNLNHQFDAPSDALYVVFIGGNDVREALVETDKMAAKMRVKNAANAVQAAIESLTLSGAKSFLVVNAPNVSIIPETQLIAAATNNPELLKRARKLSQKYRGALHEVVELLEEQHEIEITEFDLFKFFNKLVENADEYGFTNSTEACFSSVSFSFNPGCGDLGENFDQYIFFDEIHPTARVHAIVGEAMAEAILEEDDDDEEEDNDD